MITTRAQYRTNESGMSKKPFSHTVIFSQLAMNVKAPRWAPRGEKRGNEEWKRRWLSSCLAPAADGTPRYSLPCGYGIAQTTSTAFCAHRRPMHGCHISAAVVVAARGLAAIIRRPIAIYVRAPRTKITRVGQIIEITSVRNGEKCRGVFPHSTGRVRLTRAKYWFLGLWYCVSRQHTWRFYTHGRHRLISPRPFLKRLQNRRREKNCGTRRNWRHAVQLRT